MIVLILPGKEGDTLAVENNPMEAIQQLFSKIESIAVGMARLETKIEDIGNVRQMAVETKESTKSAHHRIDTVEKDIAEKIKAMREENNTRFGKIEKVINWAGTTVIGGVIIGVLSLLFKLK